MPPLYRAAEIWREQKDLRGLRGAILFFLSFIPVSVSSSSLEKESKIEKRVRKAFAVSSSANFLPSLSAAIEQGEAAPEAVAAVSRQGNERVQELRDGD